MPTLPKISVIVPSFNQGAFVERTILSVLRQRYGGEVELIVSDGGSSDNTLNVLERYRDKLIFWSEADEGFVDAVTKGLAVATGEIVAIQSSDDFYLEGAFENVAAGFAANRESSFITGGELAIDLEYRVCYTNTADGIITPASILLSDAHVPQNSTFVKKPWIEAVGGLRREVDLCSDGDLWYRISALQPGAYIPEVVSAYQLHPNQRTASGEHWYANYRRMIESCETRAEHPIRIFVNEQERRSAYLFFELLFTGRSDPLAAQQLARRHATSLPTHTARTRRELLRWLYYTPPSSLSKYANIARKIIHRVRQLRERTAAEGEPKSTAGVPDLLWWQTEPSGSSAALHAELG